MQALRLTTSPFIFLVLITPKYQTHLQLGPALKHILNHDITRCLSSRVGKQPADEDNGRILSDSVVFQNVFRPEGAPLVQKLSDKSGVQTSKFHSLYQTERDEARSVQNITGRTIKNSHVSKNKSATEHQESARLGGSFIASTQMLSDLSGTPKDKINKPSKRRKRKKQKKPTEPNMSLFDELFPEDSDQAVAPDAVNEGEEVIPRLSLVDFDDEDDFYNDAQNWKHSEDGRIERPNVKDALHERDLAVLVVNRASKSLIESDFRRLIPRGQHIGEWRGPGDILKGELTQIISILIVF